MFCSLTSSFHAKSAPSNTNEPTTSTNSSNNSNNMVNSGEASANVEKSKNSKYFSEIDSLYILGKHYPNPIGEICFKSILKITQRF